MNSKGERLLTEIHLNAINSFLWKILSKKCNSKATDWEKVFTLQIFDKGLILRIYKESLGLNKKEK